MYNEYSGSKADEFVIRLLQLSLSYPRTHEAAQAEITRLEAIGLFAHHFSRYRCVRSLVYGRKAMFLKGTVTQLSNYEIASIAVRRQMHSWNSR